MEVSKHDKLDRAQEMLDLHELQFQALGTIFMGNMHIKSVIDDLKIIEHAEAYPTETQKNARTKIRELEALLSGFVQHTRSNPDVIVPYILGIELAKEVWHMTVEISEPTDSYEDIHAAAMEMLHQSKGTCEAWGCVSRYEAKTGTVFESIDQIVECACGQLKLLGCV